MQPLLISALNLRRALGVLGILLAPLLVALAGMQPSLSAYHATPARDVFVGALCSIGIFLVVYRGYDRRDAIASCTAGLCAIVVALVPFDHPQLAHLHLAAAAVFFVVLAGMSFFLFTQTGGNPTSQKLNRNTIYRVCGLTMMLCVVFAGMGGSLFWMESVAVVAFGVSWLVKGEAILEDQPAA
jgi:hypothetical protein